MIARRETEQALASEREGAQQLLAEKAQLEQRLEHQVCEGSHRFQSAGRTAAMCLAADQHSTLYRPTFSPPALLIYCVACRMQREHMTAEKNASLESLVRATAAATTQAGKLVSDKAGFQVG